MRKIIFIFKFFKHWLSAKSKFSLHSPFIYKLYVDIIKQNTKSSEFFKIEKLRKKLLNNNNSIKVTDFGAGSKLAYSNERKIKDIALHYSKTQKQCKLLYRLINEYQPSTVLELGTSLGISTMYQAIAHHQSKLTTIEGCPNTATIAKRNFKNIGLENIKLIIGNFDDKLPEYLASISELDYAFIDGNHTKKATIDYFLQCLNKSHSNTILVFDDIHWSDEMEQAWEFIKKNKKVKITVDLFFLGLVFFRDDLSKQDYCLKF